MCNQLPPPHKTRLKGANDILSSIYSLFFSVCIYSWFGFIVPSFTFGQGQLSSPSLSSEHRQLRFGAFPNANRARTRSALPDKTHLSGIDAEREQTKPAALNRQSPETQQCFSQLRPSAPRASCSAGNIWGLQPMGAEWECIGTWSKGEGKKLKCCLKRIRCADLMPFLEHLFKVFQEMSPAGSPRAVPLGAVVTRVPKAPQRGSASPQTRSQGQPCAAPPKRPTG